MATNPLTSKLIGKHQVFDSWGFDNSGNSDPSQSPPRGIYVPGQPKGYSEGETAAFLVDMTLKEGGQYTTVIELDLFNGGAYAFLGLEDWDTTLVNAGTTFPAPPPNAGALTASVDGVKMAGATIGDTDGLLDADGVTYLGTFFSGGTWTQLT